MTWLLFGILVGGILMFTLMRASLLSPEIRNSPAVLQAECGLVSTDLDEVISCTEKCASLGKGCFAGQIESSKSLVDCRKTGGFGDGLSCVCCGN